MSVYEYKVVPAPVQGTKAKGVKTTQDRFALTLTEILNAQASDGWEYWRTDTLPCEERKGLTGRETTYQNMLIFRRSTDPTPMQTIVEQSATMPTLTLDDTDVVNLPRIGPARGED